MQNLRTSSMISRLRGLCVALAACFAAIPTFAQPANDNFLEAEVLQAAGMWGTVSNDTTGATAEALEPSHAGAVPMYTIWYKWTAPVSGEVTFDTAGSAINTLMAVYRGTEINGLAQVAANDGAWKGANSWYSDLDQYYSTSFNPTDPFYYLYLGTAGPSLVRFNAKADETYYIAVAGVETYVVDEEGFLTVVYEGPVSLSWAYKSAGVFHFTAPTYEASEDESFRRGYIGAALHNASTARHEQQGMLVTITRSMGSSGRVIVDYELQDGIRLDDTVGPAEFGVDYYIASGSVVFNDWEMSRTILVPINRSFPRVLEVLEGEEGKAMRREFTIHITNVALAEGESSDLLPPRISSRDGQAFCYILDGDVDPVMARNYVQIKGEDGEEDPPPVFTDPTNVVVNISRRYFRVREDEPAKLLCIPIVRGGTNRAAITVHYGINITGRYENTHRDNFFALTPGADYATPTPENAGVVGRGSDFEPIYGTFTLAANEWVDHIDIPITDDLMPEMNEDLLLTIWSVRDNAIYHMGQIYEANITILYDQNDAAAGSVDINYNPDYYHTSQPQYMPHPGADNTVFAMVLDPDDKAVIVGDFTTYNNTLRGRIARLQPNGSLDHSFSSGVGADDFITSIVRTSDGKYIIGGGFSFYDGIQYNGIARLNADGSVDTSFSPGAGPSGTVWALCLDNEDKILVGGSFETFNGAARRNIVRLNQNGSIDNSFSPPITPDGVVNAITKLPSGQIVIGGEFVLPTTALLNIAAYTTNGLLDLSYNAQLGAGPSGPVYAMAVQQGKLLVGGEFGSFGTFERGRLARLNADGSMDTSFDTRTGADDTVYSITVAPTGELYVGGSFTAFAGTHRLGFARLYPNGTVDTTFLDTAYNHFAGLPREYYNSAMSPKSFVMASGVASDGGVIIAGGFSQVGGGYSQEEIQIPDVPDFGYLFDPYFEAKNRAAIRNRHNVARLVGGATSGPGNLGLLYDTYTVNDQQSLLYVSLVRENGGLGYVTANFNVIPSSAVAGSDFHYNAIPSTYRGTWAGTMATEWGNANPWSRMKSDSYLGTNGAVIDIYGNPWPPEPWLPPDPALLCVVGIANDGAPGSRYGAFELSIPSGSDHWYPGGENVPICSALGRSMAPLSIIDDRRDAGTLGFSMATYAVSEGTNALITVKRTDGTSGSVSVRFATVSGTASPNVDYYTTNGLLTFGPGVTSRSFYVRIIPNSLITAKDRTLTLRLTDPSGSPKAPALGQAEAVLSIIDDDFPNGFVNFSTATYATNEGTGAVVMTLNRTGGSTGSLRVYYRTQNGTAMDGVDYVGQTNFVQWANLDVTPKTITIPFVPNDIVTVDRFFTNVLFAALVNNTTNNLVIQGSTPSAAVRIVEDDNYGFAQFSAPSYRVNERAGTATITVTRASGSSQSLSVGFRTLPGTAYGTGPDVLFPNYVTTNGVLNFLPGELAKTFEVTILHDWSQNPSSFYFNVALSNSVPAGQLGWPVVAQVNIIDAETYNFPAGGLDFAFHPDPGFNGDVYALALQPDGKLIVGGDFTLVNNHSRNRLARILSNGGVDTTFQTGLLGANGSVRAVTLQSDERIVVAGSFTQIGGVVRNRIARLLSDGSIDSSFGAGTGADGPVLVVTETFIGSERRLLVGGSFNSVNGQLRTGIARLKNTGALDDSFNPNLTLDGPVYAIVTYPTNTTHGGKILVGGDFTTVNGVSRNGLARLNADGTLDPTFDPGVGANGAVRSIALQLDGQILAGGEFTSFRGQPLNRIVRLTPVGLVDIAFNVGQGANDTVEAIRVLPDNKILIAGQFTSASGVYRSRITRLLPNGSVDPSINFEEGANGTVHTVVVQPDDEMMLLGGSFTSYAGHTRNGLARVFGGAMAGSGSFEFTTSHYQVNEGVTNAWITLKRRGGTAGAIGVQVATSAGTALPGVNYVNINTNVIFPEGEIIKAILVPILRDVQITPDLTVNLDITSVQSPGEIGNQPDAVLTIFNTDNVVRFASATWFRSEAAVDGAATIQIVREGGLRLGASVQFRTSMGGTAVPFQHYVPVSTTVEFEPDQQTANVKILLIRDPVAQGNLTVTMDLSSGMGTLLSVPNEAVLTIIDADEAPGLVRFASTNLSVSESAGALTVNVLRTFGQTGVIEVDYTTVPGTALDGGTYQSVSGKLTFLDGETAKSFQVPIFNNPMTQGDSLFYVALTNASGGAAIMPPGIVPVTVLDDDVSLSFSSPAYTTFDKDGSVALTVIRRNGTNMSTTVNYATTNVTAMAETNYTTTAGTLIFAPGETIKNFNIPIKRDPRITGMLSLGVNLFNATSPAQLVNPSAAVVVIIDTDSGFTFADYNSVKSNITDIVGIPVYSTFKSAPNVTITVMRTNETPDTVSVNYLTTNGTAIAGVDYSPVSGTLVFSNGAQTVSFTVPILNNRVADADKTFEVVLSNPTTGLQILPPGRAIIAITNDLAGIGFSSPAYSVRENAVNATITVVRSAYTNSAVWVDYEMEDGSALNGIHYVRQSGTLSFGPGQIMKTFSVTVLDNTQLDVDHTVQLSLKSFSTNAVPVTANAVLTILEDDGSFVLPAGMALVTESGPINNTVDPNETITVRLALRNASGNPTTNLVGTLLPGPGVSSPSGVGDYGELKVQGASKYREFEFTATGTNGQPIALVLQLTDGATSVSNAVFNLSIGNVSRGYTNGSPIVINEFGPATPYPSTINVTGVGGSVSKVSVTLTNFTHVWPEDVSMILVSPSGSRSYVMSRVGGAYAVTNVTLTFEDSAPAVLARTNKLVSSTNRPTCYAQVTPMFPTPAPVGPYGTNFSVFDGENPNGAWSLYVYDGRQGLAGAISNGWTLRLGTGLPVSADLGVSLDAMDTEVYLSDNIDYTVNVENYGPSDATNVLVVTDPLPPGTVFVSADRNRGSYVTNAVGQILWSVGSLPVGVTAQMTVTLAATTLGDKTTKVSISSGTSDLNADNNTASAVTKILSPEADLSVSIVGSANPVGIGVPVTYTITVANAGGADAPGVTATYLLPAGVEIISVEPEGYTLGDGKVILNLGVVQDGWQASGSVVVVPYIAGTNENYVICGSDATDPLKLDNEASTKTVVIALQFSAMILGPNIVLSWDSRADIQGIEATPALLPPSWTEVENLTMTTAGGRTSVAIPRSGEVMFYRPKAN